VCVCVKTRGETGLEDKRRQIKWSGCSLLETPHAGHGQWGCHTLSCEVACTEEVVWEVATWVTAEVSTGQSHAAAGEQEDQVPSHHIMLRSMSSKFYLDTVGTQRWLSCKEEDGTESIGRWGRVNQSMPAYDTYRMLHETK